MLKGMSRRVVVVESPDPRFFEQAIFILRSDAGEGVSSREVVEEARRVARDYIHGGRAGKLTRFQDLSAPVWCLTGAAAVGLAWLLVWLV